MTDAASSPFPPRRFASVRVASVGEEYAFIQAYPLPAGPWTVGMQTLFVGKQGPEDHLRLTGPEGEPGMIRFAIGSFFGGATSLAEDPDAVSHVMEAALNWLKENEPFHPGVMPRFPVPASGYPGRVAVPMALVAVDDNRQAGLYGPARAVILSYPAGEITGAIDAPGFSPDRWPPPSRGAWPPAGVAAMTKDQLAGAVRRFSALWDRLLRGFMNNVNDDPWQADEAAEALLLLRRLDPPGMLAAYRALNPGFSDWLMELANQDEPPAE